MLFRSVDIDKDCIVNSPKNNINYIEGLYYDINFKQIDILLLLGAHWMENERDFFEPFIGTYKPRIILLETFLAKSHIPSKDNPYVKGLRNWYWHKSFNMCMKVLLENGYNINESDKYYNNGSTMGKERGFAILK